jgi:hypothetical protein
MITFTSQGALGCSDLSQPTLSALIFDTGVLAVAFRAFSLIQDMGMMDRVYPFSQGCNSSFGHEIPLSLLLNRPLSPPTLSWERQ